MILYGDADLEAVLRFLDEKHLSRFKSRNLNLRPLFEGPVSSGFRKTEVKSPAYEGSPAEHSSVIDYTIDLSGLSQEDVICMGFCAGMMDQDTSPVQRAARSLGLNNIIDVYLDTALARPVLKFRLQNGDKEQQELFFQAVNQGLADMAENGIADELYHAVIKENRLADLLMRETPHLAFICPRISDASGALPDEPTTTPFTNVPSHISVQIRNSPFCAGWQSKY